MTANNPPPAHTAGPWIWDKFAHGCALVSQSEMAYGTTRKAVDLSYEGPNSAIIAAAPEMAEALKAALEFIDCDKRHSNPEIAAYARRVCAQITDALKEAGVA